MTVSQLTLSLAQICIMQINTIGALNIDFTVSVQLGVLSIHVYNEDE